MSGYGFVQKPGDTPRLYWPSSESLDCRPDRPIYANDLARKHKRFQWIGKCLSAAMRVTRWAWSDGIGRGAPSQKATRTLLRVLGHGARGISDAQKDNKAKSNDFGG